MKGKCVVRRPPYEREINMKTQHVRALALTMVLLCPITSAFAADKKGKHHKPANAKKSGGTKGTGAGLNPKKPFLVYEHIHNRGRPDDLTSYGLVPIELCYNTRTKEGVQASVKKKLEKSNGAPIVFDIEKTNRNDHDVSTRHLKEVVKWAHEAVPGVKVGHYAVGPSHLTPLNRPIKKDVDAFFPSMYVHNTNRRAWAHTARELVQQGHREHKPVFLFLMPKFHGRKGGDVPQSFWAFQLRCALHSGADGVVIWSSDRDKWDENAGWWQATKKFMEELKTGHVAKQ